MTRKLRAFRKLASLAAVACLAHNIALANPNTATEAQVSQIAKTIATEFAAACPVADPSSGAAFESCRQTIYRDSAFKRALPDFVLWGRQRDPANLLKATSLTQFGADVISSMYLPMFMFNGKHTVTYDEREKRYLIRLQAGFRNRLAPGEYPYPFWHQEEKWTMYEKANEILFWWDAEKTRIHAAQFTVFGSQPSLVALQPIVQAKFNGEWVWTDASGNVQPKVSLFDGLFAANNPYLQPLDNAYKKFALQLRDGQCMGCHVPNNPDGMKRLVLLQTPVHAAAEIKRVLKSVRDDRMPRDEAGIEQPLNAALKAALLNEGAQFEKQLEEAKRWELSKKVSATTAK